MKESVQLHISYNPCKHTALSSIVNPCTSSYKINASFEWLLLLIGANNEHHEVPAAYDLSVNKLANAVYEKISEVMYIIFWSNHAAVT